MESKMMKMTSSFFDKLSCIMEVMEIKTPLLKYVQRYVIHSVTSRHYLNFQDALSITIQIFQILQSMGRKK